MKKNGTTTKGEARWRCKNPGCGASTTHHRPNQTHTRDFRAFHAYVAGTASLTGVADTLNISRRTLDRRFASLWLIDVPNIPDPNRICNQIFINGTYTDAGCLLVAASHDHVIAWHWTKHETAHAYTQLFRKIVEPFCVALDGGQGALTAIKAYWPNAIIQRCLIHAQRVIRRYTTLQPRTDADKAIYALAFRLTKIATVDQARDWTLHLHNFGQVFKIFLDEKTPMSKERRTLNNQWEWTHLRVRKAYNSLLHLSRNDWLFTYLQPPPNALEPQRWASTTNSLEGGINTGLKRIVDAHRGRSGERQRKMLKWYLHSKTQLPDDPLKIARQCNYGQGQPAKVNGPVEEDHSKADQETGRPAFYDNAIPTEYEHSIGIGKGPMQ